MCKSYLMMTTAIMEVEPIQICQASMAHSCRQEDHLPNLISISRNMALHPREMAEVAS